MKFRIHTQILLAVIAGTGLGLLLGSKQAEYIGYVNCIKMIGDVFLRLLQMIIIPLILASMVCAVVGLRQRGKLGRLGLCTFAYYAATTLLAVGLGLVLVNLINPGRDIDLRPDQAAQETQREQPRAADIITDIVPSNIIAAMARDKVLSVILFALIFGVAINSLGQKAKPLVDFFEAFNDAMMKLTGWIMRLAPIGVFALMAAKVAEMGLEILPPLAMYMATVIVGLSLHAVVTLPLLLILFARYSPLRFIKHIFNAVATAFSTASSAATLPITIECVEKNAGLGPTTAGFVLPIGATVNMDGTALYEAVAAVFIAQAYGIHLDFSQQLVVMLTATLASVGAAAIPSAGLVTMTIVLRAVDLPLEAVAMIAAVDRILDMLRTAVNVWGDACGVAIVSRLFAVGNETADAAAPP